MAARREPPADPPRDDHGPWPADLGRALAWLRAHPDASVRLAELAAAACVPARTLQTHFRQFLGTTPLGWVRQQRLAAARHALVSSGGATSVSRVALDHGFRELGRFAAAYRRGFGESPSRTLGRARLGEIADGSDDEAQRLTWTALPAAFAVAPVANAAALDALERAQALAPGYGLAKAVAAWCWSQRAAQRFATTPAADLARGLRLAQEACRLATDDPLALAVASGAFTLAHRLDEADRVLARALALDPRSAVGWLRRGWASAYYGDAEVALRELRTALALMPFAPVAHLAYIGLGFAHFAAGRHDRAARWIESGVAAAPGCQWAERMLVAAALHAGERDAARRRARRLLRTDPTLTVEFARDAWPLRHAARDRLADGLAAAGVPRA